MQDAMHLVDVLSLCNLAALKHELVKRVLVHPRNMVPRTLEVVRAITKSLVDHLRIKIQSVHALYTHKTHAVNAQHICKTQATYSLQNHSAVLLLRFGGPPNVQPAPSEHSCHTVRNNLPELLVQHPLCERALEPLRVAIEAWIDLCVLHVLIPNPLASVTTQYTHKTNTAHTLCTHCTHIKHAPLVHNSC
jgi:hypothetical protein